RPPPPRNQPPPRAVHLDQLPGQRASVLLRGDATRLQRQYRRQPVADSLRCHRGRELSDQGGDYDSADGGGLLDFNFGWIPSNDVCTNATRVNSTSFHPPPYNTANADLDP